ncbi:hypothetical protein [Rhizobium herbae]|jgi:hypothetical protein
MTKIVHLDLRTSWGDPVRFMAADGRMSDELHLTRPQMYLDFIADKGRMNGALLGRKACRFACFQRGGERAAFIP